MKHARRLLWSALALAIAVPTLAQSIDWIPITLEEDSSLLHEHAIADLDGDGDLDIATAYWDSTLWFENMGDALTWTRHAIDIGKPVEKGFEAADFDGDGDIDLAIAATAQFYYPAWFENDGLGNFTRHTLTEEHYGYAATTIDLDLDGDLDFAYFTQIGDNRLIGWIDSPGGWQMEVLQTFDAGLTGDIVTVDWDLDGDDDLMGSIPWNNVLGEVFVMEWDGEFWERTVLTGNTRVKEMSVVDLDQDGNFDLVGSRSQDHIVVWQHPGYWQVSTLAGDTSWPNHTVGDMDGDGDLDVVANSVQDLYLYEQQDDHSFTSHIFSEAGVFSADMTAVDIDADGDDDLVVNYAHPGTLQIFFQPGQPEPVEVIIQLAQDPPIILVPGEALSFDLRLVHHLLGSQDLVLWSEAVTPGGETVGPFATAPVTVEGNGFRLFPGLTQTVPLSTQPGAYTFRVVAGENLQSPLESDQVEVTVVAP